MYKYTHLNTDVVIPQTTIGLTFPIPSQVFFPSVPGAI